MVKMSPSRKDEHTNTPPRIKKLQIELEKLKLESVKNKVLRTPAKKASEDTLKPETPVSNQNLKDAIDILKKNSIHSPPSNKNLTLNMKDVGSTPNQNNLLSPFSTKKRQLFRKSSTQIDGAHDCDMG